jgi:hypothetical protein
MVTFKHTSSSEITLAKNQKDFQTLIFLILRLQFRAGKGVMRLEGVEDPIYQSSDQ